MIPTVVALLIATFVRPGHTQEVACSAPEPLLIPVGNTTITDSEVSKWGLKFNVGTPAQTLVPQINADWNSTSLWPPDLDCDDDDSHAACAWDRGGSFDPEKSSSWAESTDDDNTFEFRPSDGTQLGITPWGTDTITLGPDATIEKFPIYSSSVGTVPQNALGLGRDSTLLDMLLNESHIASRTWSLFWGWQGEYEEQQMEGNLVLGGYDKAKTEGRENTTIDFAGNAKCPTSMLVSITDITMNRITGETEELLADLGTTLQSCIKPDAPLMTFPKSIYDKFKKLFPGEQQGSSDGLYGSGMSYTRMGAFAGNITFTIDGNFPITIPNHQLVLPNIGLVDDTNEQARISDNDTIMIYDNGVSDMPLLGQAFLSSVYLHVNNDQRKFTLWEVNPKTETELVTVKDGMSGCEIGNAGDGQVSSGAPGVRPSPDSGLSAGAIAGIAVVATLAGLALIGLIAFILWRRHKRNAKGKSETHAAAMHAVDAKGPPPANQTEYGMGELDGGQGYQVLPEMNVREASATAELPGDNRHSAGGPGTASLQSPTSTNSPSSPFPR